MTAYLVDPRLLGLNDDQSRQFHDHCRSELERHLQVGTISSEIVMSSTQPSAKDALIFLNRPDQNYPPSFLALVAEAADVCCWIAPVALTMDRRTPPLGVAKAQSFDVPEQLRCRALPPTHIETAAMELARTVVARLQPTLSKQSMHLFISYRRFDGEQLAGSLYDGFQLRAQQGFRDLSGVLCGQDANEVIHRNLRASDVVVFLDTPRSGESCWIAEELKTALSMNIPIVWV